MIYAVYFILCFLATTAGAISGIGGGVIIKPFMDALSGLDVSTVSFLSGCTVLAMSAVSLLRGLPLKRRGQASQDDERLDMRVCILLAVGAAVGGVVGKGLFDFLGRIFPNDSLTGAIQSILIFILTGAVFIYTLKKEAVRQLHVTNMALILVIGLLLGTVSAFLGIGGGPINIAVLSFFFGMNTKSCALNSLFVILCSQATSLLGTVITASWPAFDPGLLLLMIVGGVAGGLAGSLLSKRMAHRHVDRLFCGMMLVIMGISVYNSVQFLGIG